MIGTLLVTATASAALALGVATRSRRRRRADWADLARAFGWEVSRDQRDPTAAYGLDQAPFGLGTGRVVEHSLRGRSSSGRPFVAFAYRTKQHRVDGAVLRTPISTNLPSLQVSRPDGVPYASGFVVDHPWLRVVAEDPAVARVLLPAVEPLLQGLLSTPGIVFGVDHEALLLIGVPDDPRELLPLVEQLAQVAAAVERVASVRAGAEPVPAMGVHHLPGWTYRPRDDSLLSRVHPVRPEGGWTSDVVCAPGPLPMVALTHVWETTTMVSTTGADGMVTMSTTTQQESRRIVSVLPRFWFPPIRVLRSRASRGQEFESADFNARFSVIAPDRRFRSDVMHPRMMRWLLEQDPPPFAVLPDGSLRIEVPPGPLDDADLARLVWAQDFARGFFARVPDFVWQNLGLWPRPVPGVAPEPPRRLLNDRTPTTRW